LLLATDLRHLKLDKITPGIVATVQFPGSGSNANTAIRTLRRLLNLAHEEGKLSQVPKLRNRAEVKRKLCLDDAAEALLFPHLKLNTRDALTIMRDCGSRNFEVLSMRWEYVNWQDRTFCNAEGKTEAAARVWLLSDRVMEILSARHVRQNAPRSGWVFPSKKSKSGHIMQLDYVDFARVRERLGISSQLVPYCARHDFGTVSMVVTGNPGVVAGMMGHSSPSITLNHYNHPPRAESERIRALVNSRLCTKSAHSPKSNIVEIPVSNAK
jgi:integrase